MRKTISIPLVGFGLAATLWVAHANGEKNVSSIDQKVLEKMHTRDTFDHHFHRYTLKLSLVDGETIVQEVDLDENDSFYVSGKFGKRLWSIKGMSSELENDALRIALSVKMGSRDVSSAVMLRVNAEDKEIAKIQVGHQTPEGFVGESSTVLASIRKNGQD